MFNFKLHFLGFQCDNYHLFKSAEALSSPSRVDQNEDSVRRFKCNFCPYSTNIKCNIKNHSMVHSGERPHKCEVCSRSFNRLHVLKTHMLIHTGEKPYLCNVCNMSFRHACNLRVHMHKHL